MGMQQTSQHKNIPNLSETLRMITGAPWFVSNLTLHNYFKIPFVHEEITFRANKYKPRTTDHSNQLISELFQQTKDVKDSKEYDQKTLLGFSREPSMYNISSPPFVVVFVVVVCIVSALAVVMSFIVVFCVLCFS
jgi:hypothetical protein